MGTGTHKPANLTKSLIESLKPDPARNVIRWDADVKGFGVVVSRGGHRAFIFQYSPKGTKIKRQIRLGAFGVLTVEAARIAARRLRTRVDEGGDPAVEAKEREQAPRVAELVERFLAEHAALKSASTLRNAELITRLYLLPALKTRTVASVTWNDIAKIHRDLAGTPYMGNRTVACASVLFEFARKIGWYPATSLNPGRSHHRHAEQARGRALSAEQLSRLGAALAQDPDPIAAGALRFALLTGARPGEVLAARWAEIDFSARVWGLTASKVGPRQVFLGRPAVAVLEALPRCGDFVFPGTGKGGHRAGLSSAWERVRSRAELPPEFRLYDLRHSFATSCSELRIPLEISYRMTGHATGYDAGSRYRHPVKVCLEAADTVSDWIERALSGEIEAEAEPVAGKLLSFG